MYDLVIFDCDGVLVDSEGLSARVLMEALDRHGVRFDGAYFRQHMLGRSFSAVVSAVRRDFGVTLPRDFEADFTARLLEVFAAELRTTAGLEPMLDKLALPVCVATSSGPSRTVCVFEITGLASRFGDRVFTASEVANGKPAPDLFLHAAARCGAAPDRCLVLEDSAAGLQAAAAAGMASLHYRGGVHLRDTARDLDGSLGSIRDWAEFPALLPEVFATRTA